MKKIDLLYKIWKDELADKTKVIFKKHNTECIYHKNERRFEFVNKGDWNDYFNTFTLDELDNEVEITEQKPKKLNKINYENACTTELLEEAVYGMCEQINKQTRVLNYLLEKSDSE